MRVKLLKWQTKFKITYSGGFKNSILPSCLRYMRCTGASPDESTFSDSCYKPWTERWVGEALRMDFHIVMSTVLKVQNRYRQPQSRCCFRVLHMPAAGPTERSRQKLHHQYAERLEFNCTKSSSTTGACWHL